MELFYGLNQGKKFIFQFYFPNLEWTQFYNWDENVSDDRCLVAIWRIKSLK